MVLDSGFVPLSSFFRAAFPGVTYNAGIAKERILKMPLATICIGKPSSGKSQVYVMEYMHGLNYNNVPCLLEHVGDLQKTAHASTTISINREEVDELLKIATSDRERELLRYTIYRATGVTPTAARRHFGFERMQARCEQVEECLRDAKALCKHIEELSVAQEAAVLDSLGINPSDSDSSSDNESTCTDSEADEHDTQVGSNLSFSPPSKERLHSLVVQSKFNWFEIMDTLLPDDVQEVNEHVASESCIAVAQKLELSAEEGAGSAPAVLLCIL